MTIMETLHEPCLKDTAARVSKGLLFHIWIFADKSSLDSILMCMTNSSMYTLKYLNVTVFVLQVIS